MSKIRILDDDVISKIAAGEVIERPASVVKELVENSIDANSTNINIEIENGGITYIKVSDDGSGIEKDDVEIAFLRHTTSKIQNENDLYNIKTLGFRGEALASIAAVSKVEMITKTNKDIIGTRILVEGGEIIEKTECGSPNGTTIVVRELFFNTPVRLKFLKTPSREAMYVTETVQNLALSNENISFKYKNNGKLVLATKGDGILLNVIISLFGKQVKDNLLEVLYEEDCIKVRGYIGNNALGKSNRNFEFLFVNGRYVKNKIINSAIENVYKSYSTGDKFPFYVIKLEIDPQIIDVNVHPTKAEVKFQNEQQVYKIVYKAIQNAFQTINTIPQITFTPNVFINKEDNKYNDCIQKKIEFNYETLCENNNYNKERFQIKEDTQNRYFANNFYEYFENKEKNIKTMEIIDNSNNLLLPKLIPVAQIHLTYIIAEGEKELYIIDQHAAHERILYEKYMDEYNNTSIQSQALLNPKIIELSNVEKQLVLENIKNFGKIGYVIEDFGGSSISIRSVPVIYGNPNYIELFYEVLNQVTMNSNNFYNSIDKIIYTMACKSAVKSGDKLTYSEMNKLIEDLRKCKNPFSCPHGRPTIIKMAYEELEKKFRRVL
ncbi:DNA mismatch repair protein MutL [Caloramator fervidus]|uniref:DNA mismatch repair protein MutL n=1 Tax=Caloramator fervidus TaxID=29344 RepID=A0A1H5S8V9_9CLOT|nr:DNA mismatch repair endonuclease MutL [Caloramator fervidus]SEF47053.1 DNA mismatch repair protein MutL [Caloramator fervidus]